MSGEPDAFLLSLHIISHHIIRECSIQTTITSHSYSLESSLGSPMTPSAAHLQSDAQDRETLKAALDHEDDSNIFRELSGTVGNFVSRTFEGKLTSVPKVGRTSKYDPSFNDAP
jgi:hypothetical protein